ncbi:MAG: LCP family protein [Anaerolineaceae bacterium]|nr:LCP family protein [Anaerolineaceae bacterium]
MMDKNDPFFDDETRPVRMRSGHTLNETQPMRHQYDQDDGEEPLAQYKHIDVTGMEPTRRKRTRRRRRLGCGPFVLLLPILLILIVYLLLPLRTNILILGMDSRPDEGNVSRTDTNIVLSVNPLKPVVNMLSIPRDLWVSIPNVGENRINTAHFFAEANQAGSGPSAAMQTIRQNFGLTIDYYMRLRFDGFKDIVDAMGGITLDLAEPMSGYDAGTHHLDGEQALAFVRDRKGSDDFFRMQHGQMMIVATVKRMMNPLSWLRLPWIISAAADSVDTNIPVWEMPRIGLAILRGVIGGTIDTRTISREMVYPTTTADGAAILLPNWQAINPMLMELFGE